MLDLTSGSRFEGRCLGWLPPLKAISGGARALIVATTAATRDTLGHQLTTLGGSGLAVANSDKALAAIRTQTFDLALIDAQGVDALALAREIRAVGETKSMPLVVVTTVERDKAELTKAGFHGSILKPVKSKELFNCVAKVTGRLNVSVSAEDRQALEADSWTAVRRRDLRPAHELHWDVAGTHVLVAEDNPVNRDIAMRMLRALKCSVEVVVDGAQAVEAVQRERYDLVLLDCQMPTLDGYEAARQIRLLEKHDQTRPDGTALRSKHLPLVALTAHTSPTDRARALESGMDDFVCKPITFKILRGVLEKWVRGRVESPAPPPPPASPDLQPNMDDTPISKSAFERILEIDRLEGGDVLARVVNIFIESAEKTLERLHTSLRAGDAAGLAQAAHALKGSSLNVGAVPLAAVCHELETLGESGTTEGAEPLATKAGELYLAAKGALGDRVEQDSGAGTPSVVGESL